MIVIGDHPDAIKPPEIVLHKYMVWQSQERVVEARRSQTMIGRGLYRDTTGDFYIGVLFTKGSLEDNGLGSNYDGLEVRDLAKRSPGI